MSLLKYDPNKNKGRKTEELNLRHEAAVFDILTVRVSMEKAAKVVGAPRSGAMYPITNQVIRKWIDDGLIDMDAIHKDLRHRLGGDVK